MYPSPNIVPAPIPAALRVSEISLMSYLCFTHHTYFSTLQAMHSDRIQTPSKSPEVRSVLPNNCSSPSLEHSLSACESIF